MKITVKEYSEMVKNQSPNSPHLKNFLWAFIVGGIICAMSEVFFQIFEGLNIEEENARLLASVTLIFEAALLTGLGVFDKIAKRAGAGTLVPITGFANAVVSSAIEYKKEGFVLGVGANMFKIAGPVIVYGTVASVIYGIIYWVIKMF